ncbi:Poly [ADP-ribose] polymerase 12 [Triplophysa tibetana]|uniref:Poly [ADP-ribose] polymerase 12 n=1 Tax=Triplophysa tibetana TaxID=1572043 RepID=A0A5A9PIM9_9TELE|nr:Poly [ADP-ribose] polymerase 12 [Triplophysa tibetana]
MAEASLIQLICDNNGSIDQDELVSVYMFSGDVMNLIESRNESFPVVNINGRKKVIVRTKLRLCRAQNCSGCAKLHLCKHYLFGSCPFNRGRRVCRFSHDLNSGQNSALLQSHDLHILDRQQLCVLLLQNDNSLLPPVCFNYNNGTGEFGRCEDGENCRRLHICQKYLRGACECHRSHDFYEPNPLKILQDRNVPTELMAILKDLYTNIEALRQLTKNQPSGTNTAGQRTREGPQFRRPSNPQNVNKGQKSQTEKTEICMYYIKGHCIHGDSCRKEHSSLPYQWQVTDGCEWKTLPDNEAVERDYCNPANLNSSGVQVVNFDMMTRGPQPVRRLSTVSSVVQPTFILTTEWIWHWENEFGNWIQYGTADGGQRSSTISSVEIEQKYQADSRGVMEFSAGSQTYELNFTDMIQTNRHYGTKKLVRRRPKFVSAADVHTVKTTKRAPNNFKTLPEHWDKSLTPDTGFKKVSLSSSSSEYNRIQQLFNTTMRGFNIHRIQRIQNKALWEVFQWQKDQMKKNNGGRNVEEKQLFHGTDTKHLDAICLNNLDWRICGTHGTAYGKGSYFARDAQYSHSYTKDSGTMFVCRILVGDYTKGESGYLRPPSKDGGDTLFYHSCVNDVYNPTIFVVFEKHQIYPEYLIEYRESSPVTYTTPSYTPSSYTPSSYTPPSYTPPSYTPSSNSSSKSQSSSSKSDCIIS